MAIKDAFIAEVKYESALTKKMLERVPMDKKDWKPHERSMTLGRLATHIAELTHWISDIISFDDFDFATRNLTAGVAASTEDLIQVFSDKLGAALTGLAGASDEDLSKRWVVRMGDKIMYDTPKKVAIRAWAMSHMIHHRGQLSVYLRLLNVPVPGMYGPTADEPM